jgi:16S rRNA (guanine966-N2)-methyltransferase
MNKTRSSRARSGDNTLRIIGGRWRGRKLHFPSAPGLRPTGDRVRETLFNWLAPRLPGAHCLDLFAGSGALGLEALSRGAASSVLIDSSAPVCRALRDHGQTLQAGPALQVVQADALAWLNTGEALQQGRFAVAFVDPPFQAGILDRVLETLAHAGVLAPNALIYIEHATTQAVGYPAGWRTARQQRAGQVSYALLEAAAVATAAPVD